MEIVFPILIDDRYIGAFFIGERKFYNQEKFERLHAVDLSQFEDELTLNILENYRKTKVLPETALDELISLGKIFVSLIMYVLKEKIKSGEYTFEFYERLYSEYSPDLRLIEKATALLSDHNEKLFTLSILAKELNCSISTLKQHFYKHLHIGFSAYYSNLKVASAKNLLIHTDQTTRTISEKLGYSAPSSLYKKFKEKTGMTMTEFRIKNKKMG